MNSLTEKEKKLNTVLDKLKNLSFKNPELDNNIIAIGFKGILDCAKDLELAGG